jgi:hypothetical protein
MTWHRWMSTDDDQIDQCLQCGTAAPHHGGRCAPLPVECPGSRVEQAHHFIDGPEGIECVYCPEVITEDTPATDVRWDCVEH